MMMNTFAYKTICTILIVSFLFTCFPVSLFSQATSSELVKQGREYYEEAEFDLAMETLNMAISQGFPNINDEIFAYTYLAFCYSALGDLQKAENAFLKMFALKPDYNLSVTQSPRFLEPVQKARQRFEAMVTRPEIEHTAVSTGYQFGSIDISLKLTINYSDVISSIFYREKGKKDFEILVLTKTAPFTYQGAFSVKDKPVEYYLKVENEKDEKLAQWKSPQTPQTVILEEPPKESVLRDELDGNIAIQSAQIKKGGTWKWWTAIILALGVGTGIGYVAYDLTQPDAEPCPTCPTLPEPPDTPQQ